MQQKSQSSKSVQAWNGIPVPRLSQLTLAWLSHGMSPGEYPPPMYASLLEKQVYENWLFELFSALQAGAITLQHTEPAQLLPYGIHTPLITTLVTH